MGEFRMPALGAGMDTGRVIEWYVKPGDRVARGDLVALVETDKANIDVEIFEDGIIESLLVEEGVKVAVGTALATITAEGSVPADTTDPEPVASPVTPTEATEVAQPSAPALLMSAPGEDHPPVVSPLVRRLAADHGVDLRQMRGTGRGGLVTRQDVERAATRPDAPSTDGSSRLPDPGAPVTTEGRASPYARRLVAERGMDLASLTGTGPAGAIIARDVPAEDAAPRPAPTAAAAGTSEPPAEPRDRPTIPAQVERGDTMRQAIARAMEQANRDIPHYYLGETVDVEGTMAWLSEVNAERQPSARLLPAVLVLKATAVTLRRYSEFNGYWVEGAFQPGDGIHLGVAISLRRGGLLAPAIRDADERSLDELMEALRDLVERTRAGGLRGSELTDPTITVSNLGDTGTETIQGVITPPQVALVGVGRITPRPWAVDGMLAVRRTMYLSLAGDHRASDGHQGARFLTAIAANLSRPETL